MSPTDEDMVAEEVSSGTHTDAYLYLLDEKLRDAPKWAHLMKMHWEYASYCEPTTVCEALIRLHHILQLKKLISVLL